MDHKIRTPDNRTYIHKPGTGRAPLLLVALAVLLCLGLVQAASARAAGLSQADKGDITGTVIVNGQSVAGITVELRQRTNGGTDATLVTATTDAAGTYHFSNQPSAPNDAFYYVRFTGGRGTLSAWYSFPIIYTFGSQVTVPSIELVD